MIRPFDTRPFFNFEEFILVCAITHGVVLGAAAETPAVVLAGLQAHLKRLAVIHHTIGRLFRRRVHLLQRIRRNLWLWPFCHIVHLKIG